MSKNLKTKTLPFSIVVSIFFFFVAFIPLKDVSAQQKPPFNVVIINSAFESGEDLFDQEYNAYDPSKGIAHDRIHGTLVTETFLDNLDKYHVTPRDYRLYGVSTSSGSENVDLDNLARGLQWARENHADVVNISLGGWGPTVTPSARKVRDELKKLKETGAVIVAGSGNEGNAWTIGYPARFDSTIAVGAGTTDENGDILFEKYTAGIDDAHLDFIAPGNFDARNVEGVRGTSFAAPRVTAAMLALKKKHPNASPDELRELLDQFTQTNNATHIRSVAAVRGDYLKGQGYVPIVNNDLVGLQFRGGKIAIREQSLNTGRFNEFEKARTSKALSEDGDFHYRSHAYQVGAYRSLEDCYANAGPRDVGGCGRIGEMVNTPNGLLKILDIRAILGEGVGSDTVFGDNINNGNDGGFVIDDHSSTTVTIPGNGVHSSGEPRRGGINGSGSNDNRADSRSGISSQAGGTRGIITGAPRLSEIVLGALRVLLQFVGALAVIAVIVSGIFYMTSRGDMNRIAFAKKALTSSIIGIVVVLISLSVVSALAKIVSGSSL